MVELLRKMWNGYLDLQHHYEHPFTKDYPLMSNPLPVLAIVACWLYFCLRCGPRFMRDRKPYELKNTIMVYNLAQIFISVYMFYWGGIYAWFFRYNWRCQPLTWPHNAEPEDIIGCQIVWLYFIVKIVDLMDTVFFVLRKKDKQITTLHVYHHALMPCGVWVGVKFAPVGHGTLVGWINAFVHIIMYTYYLIAGLGPQYQKYLWWKKHLTLLQLIQFVIIFVHNFSVLFTDCDYPKIFNWLSISEAVIFMYLFGNFYIQNYVKDAKASQKNKVKCK